MSITDIYDPESIRNLPTPLAEAYVAAGFPSPADDYLEKGLDLNEYLIKSPASTFFVRVAGDSMTNAGIHDGDLLVVDRSRSPKDGCVVIAVIDGEMAVKRLRRIRRRWALIPENEQYPSLEIGEETHCSIWGVATYVLHPL